MTEKMFARAREKIAEKGSLESLMALHGRWDIRYDGFLWKAFPEYSPGVLGAGATIREAVESAVATLRRRAQNG